MPRITDSRSDPYDFCVRCFPNKQDAVKMYGNRGDGPDNRGNCFDYNTDHPSYDSDYKCCKCKRELTDDFD